MYDRITIFFLKNILLIIDVSLLWETVWQIKEKIEYAGESNMIDYFLLQEIGKVNILGIIETKFLL